MDELTRIRQRSNNQKNLLSLFIALILTLVIVFVWYSFSNNTNQPVREETPNTLSSLSPLQVIKDEFSQAFASIGDKISGFGSSTVTVEIVSENLASSTDGIATTSTSSELITN